MGITTMLRQFRASIPSYRCLRTLGIAHEGERTVDIPFLRGAVQTLPASPLNPELRTPKPLHPVA